jgi:hypothetical protein
MYGKATQFRDIGYFVIRHSTFTTKLGMCSIVNVDSSSYMVPLWSSSRFCTVAAHYGTICGELLTAGHMPNLMVNFRIVIPRMKQN